MGREVSAVAGRLDQIERLLRPRLGGALLARCPELIYSVNEVLVRFLRTQDTLAQLFRGLDSLLFNAIYLGTERSMVVVLDDGARSRVTSDEIHDLADRLLALCYASRRPDAILQDALFDFAREGSYAAMRELLARYPIDAFDREWITQVLRENGQLE